MKKIIIAMLENLIFFYNFFIIFFINYTALIICTYRGLIDSIKDLLNYGANPNIQNLDEDTPITVAAKKGSLQIL